MSQLSSTLGGDTASALAAGCPVVVKAHEGHPATTAATAAIARAALRDAGFDPDVLNVVYGFEPGRLLIQHPAVQAAGFTGSLAGGRALFDLAARRPEPIPFFGEFGSINPVIVLPGAAAANPAGIADGYAQSLTLGSGQFCTNPGLMFVPEQGDLLTEVARAITASAGAPMLTDRMRQAYDAQLRDREQAGPGTLAAGTAQPGAWSVTPRVWAASLEEFAGPELAGSAAASRAARRQPARDPAARAGLTYSSETEVPACHPRCHDRTHARSAVRDPHHLRLQWPGGDRGSVRPRLDVGGQGLPSRGRDDPAGSRD